MVKDVDFKFYEGRDLSSVGDRIWQGGGTEGPAKSVRTAGFLLDCKKFLVDLKNLLGPLFNPLLHDAQGSLDLSKIPAKNFKEFKAYLKTQVSVDGIAFNSVWLDSYHQILGKKEYEPLLRLLYQEIPAVQQENPQGFLQENSLGELRDLSNSFAADLIEVSAEKFVGHNLQSKEGRKRLRNILGDSGYFGSETKADLLKAIASVGEQEGIAGLNFYGLNEQISTWNYFNVSVTPEEIDKATHHALEILNEGDWQEDYLADLRKKYLESPEKVRTIPFHLLGMNGKKIAAEDIQAKFKLYEESKDLGDPLTQMRAKLAHVWLLAVDSDYWIYGNSMASYENRAFVVNQLESLLEDSQYVAGDYGFRKFSERVHKVFTGYIPEAGEGASYQWIRHKVKGHGLEELFEGMPAAFKTAYQELKRYTDELHYAYDMGEHVSISVGELQTEDPELKGAISHFILGLEQNKRGLWYGYKQHKALSRLGSGVAEWFGAGDKIEIRAVNQKINEWIYQLKAACTRKDVEEVVGQLYASLKEEGLLHQALVAAEMDGIEEMIGLGQTVLIILATTTATGGTVTAAALGNAARAARAWADTVGLASAVQKIGRAAGAVAESATLASRAAWGMKMAAWLPAAENLIAVGSGEVRQAGQETLLSWGKESLATGLAMGLFTPLAARAGLALEKNVVQRLMQRYFTDGVRGLGRFAGDTTLEGMEEMVDAYVRLRLDGGSGSIGFDQFREISLVSGLGGGTKVGAMVNGFRGNELLAKSPRANSTVVGARRASLPVKGDIENSPSVLSPWASAFPGTVLGLGTLLAPEIADGTMAATQPQVRSLIQDVADEGPGMGQFEGGSNLAEPFVRDYQKVSGRKRGPTPSGILPALASLGAGLSLFLEPDIAHAAVGAVDASGAGMGILSLSFLGLGVLGMVKGGKGGGEKKQGQSMGELRYPLVGSEKYFIEKIFRREGKKPPRFIYPGNVKQVYRMVSQTQVPANGKISGSLGSLLSAIVRHFPEQMQEVYHEKIPRGLHKVGNPLDMIPYEGNLYLWLAEGEYQILLGREHFRKFVNLGYFDPLAFPRISRVHAEMLRHPKTGIMSLLDLRSTNGTFLNGKRMVPNQEVEIKEGDEIRIGGVTFILGDPFSSLGK